jgi:CBS domain-containing protein
MTHVRSRLDLGSLPVSAAVTTRGKELAATATVGDARAIFANGSVKIVPVLSGSAYRGALTREAVSGDLDLDPRTPVAELAAHVVPTALARTSSADAFAELDRLGATRLVVLDDDGTTYRGLVCLRSDRARVCVDAECHTTPVNAIDERTP